MATGTVRLPRPVRTAAGEVLLDVAGHQLRVYESGRPAADGYGPRPGADRQDARGGSSDVSARSQLDRCTGGTPIRSAPSAGRSCSMAAKAAAAPFVADSSGDPAFVETRGAARDAEEPRAVTATCGPTTSCDAGGGACHRLVQPPSARASTTTNAEERLICRVFPERRTDQRVMARGGVRRAAPPRWTPPIGSAVNTRAAGGAARAADSKALRSRTWLRSSSISSCIAQDPADALQVDALVLGEPLDQPQPGDVPRRVAPAALRRPPRRDQPHPVVGAQGLRMHPGQLGGHRDHEDRRVMVDALRQLAAADDTTSFLSRLTKSFARGLTEPTASA